jgi:hypothetical protein
MQTISHNNSSSFVTGHIGDGSVTHTRTDDRDAADGAFRIYPYLSTLNVSVRNRSYRIRSVRIGVEHPQP